MHNTVLLTVGTADLLNLLLCITEVLYPLKNNSSLPPSLTPGSLCFILCFCALALRYFEEVESRSISCSATSFFHLTYHSPTYLLYSNGLQLYCCKFQNFILFKAEKYSTISMYHFFFMHLLMYERLGVSISWLSWIMLQWTQECRYLFKVLISFPLDIYPVAGLLYHVVVLLLIVLRDLHTIFHSGCSILLPTHSSQGFQLVLILTNACYLWDLGLQPH